MQLSKIADDRRAELFEPISRFEDVEEGFVRAAVETAAEVHGTVSARGGVDHSEIAAPVTDIYHRGGRNLKVGRAPHAPIGDGEFYFLYVVPLLSTADGVRLDAYELDEDEALEGAALAQAISALELPDAYDSHAELFVDDAYEYLGMEDGRPVTGYELYKEGASLPGRLDGPEHETVLEALAELPGVIAPDPDRPDWRYIGE